MKVAMKLLAFSGFRHARKRDEIPAISRKDAINFLFEAQGMSTEFQ